MTEKEKDPVLEVLNKLQEKLKPTREQFEASKKKRADDLAEIITNVMKLVDGLGDYSAHLEKKLKFTKKEGWYKDHLTELYFNSEALYKKSRELYVGIKANYETLEQYADHYNDVKAMLDNSIDTQSLIIKIALRNKEEIIRSFKIETLKQMKLENKELHDQLYNQWRKKKA